MDSFTRPERDLNTELKDFIDYVFSFYGDVDPVYPMRKFIGDNPLNKSDILNATYDYLSTISKRNSETYTWGEGDSLDRERVRDILLNDYDFYLVHLQHGNVLWHIVTSVATMMMSILMVCPNIKLVKTINPNYIIIMMGIFV